MLEWSPLKVLRPDRTLSIGKGKSKILQQSLKMLTEINWKNWL